MELLGSLQMRAKAKTADSQSQDDHADNPVESLSRQIATLPDGEILTIERSPAKNEGS